MSRNWSLAALTAAAVLATGALMLFRTRPEPAAPGAPARPDPIDSSGSDIVIGMSAAFKGPSRGLSIELYRGSLAYFEHVNRSGGVHGKNRIVIKAYDDGYNPAAVRVGGVLRPGAIENTIRLIDRDEVFLLYGYMGSPTTARVLPLLRGYSGRGVFLFFPFTGAEAPRRAPYGEFVFNLRTSYPQEAAGLVDHFLRIGRKKIGVFYQVDAYGRSGWDGVRIGLARYDRGGRLVEGRADYRSDRLHMAAEATYRRGTTYGESQRRQVAILREAGADAVISVGTYEACAAFIRDARDAGWDVPIANVSGVDGDNLLRLLQEAGKDGRGDYTANLINSQVVPCYNDPDLPAVRQYRGLMDQYLKERYSLLPPGGLMDEDYVPPFRYSFISLEGFLNAKVLVEILGRLTPGEIIARDRRRIKGVVEGALGELEIGIDVPVLFGRDKHQGLPKDKVYYTTVSDGRFVSLKDEDWGGRWGKP